MSKKEKPVHYWWHGVDMLQFHFNFQRYANMCGIENLRVEFHPEAELHGKKGVLRIIRTTDGQLMGEYNWAHTCPPTCE